MDNAAAPQTSLRPRESFYAALNPLLFDFSEPFEVIPGHFVRRPDEIEVGRIRSSLQSIGAMAGFTPSYEAEWEIDPTRSGASHTVPLPREKWRYAVVSFQGYGDTMNHLADCLGLLTPSVEFGFQFYSAPEGPPSFMFSWHSARLFSFLSSPPSRFRHPPETLSRSELERVATLFPAYVAAINTPSAISRNLQSFKNLKTLPRESDASVLLSFAIIESLVTHKPKLIDLLDSIKHQVATKLVLLNRRFFRPVPGESYFEKASEAKMWSLLYDFRSAIAHGQEVDMNKRFASLKSREAVSRFLDEILKSLLVLGLMDPQFLEDLRAV